MLKYFISSFILLCSFAGIAQNKKPDTIKKIKKDSLGNTYYPKTYGLRIGLDLIKPTLSFTQKDYKGGEVVADYRLSNSLFAAGQLGYTQKTIEEDRFNHTAKGTYLKLGVNYNMYKNWLSMENETYLGVRYGTSFFSDNLDSYTIAQNGTYFIPKTTAGAKYNNLNANWLELVGGIKVEVFKNVFLGFMISLSKLVYANNPNNYKINYSPGMGKISKTGSASSINYTISYRIPLYKK